MAENINQTNQEIKNLKTYFAFFKKALDAKKITPCDIEINTNNKSSVYDSTNSFLVLNPSLKPSSISVLSESYSITTNCLIDQIVTLETVLKHRKYVHQKTSCEVTIGKVFSLPNTKFNVAKFEEKICAPLTANAAQTKVTPTQAEVTPTQIEVVAPTEKTSLGDVQILTAPIQTVGQAEQINGSLSTSPDTAPKSNVTGISLVEGIAIATAVIGGGAFIKRMTSSSAPDTAEQETQTHTFMGHDSSTQTDDENHDDENPDFGGSSDDDNDDADDSQPGGNNGSTSKKDTPVAQRTRSKTGTQDSDVELVENEVLEQSSSVKENSETSYISYVVGGIIASGITIGGIIKTISAFTYKHNHDPFPKLAENQPNGNTLIHPSGKMLRSTSDREANYPKSPIKKLPDLPPMDDLSSGSGLSYVTVRSSPKAALKKHDASFLSPVMEHSNSDLSESLLQAIHSTSSSPRTSEQNPSPEARSPLAEGASWLSSLFTSSEKNNNTSEHTPQGSPYSDVTYAALKDDPEFTGVTRQLNYDE